MTRSRWGMRSLLVNPVHAIGPGRGTAIDPRGIVVIRRSGIDHQARAGKLGFENDVAGVASRAPL